MKKSFVPGDICVYDRVSLYVYETMEFTPCGDQWSYNNDGRMWNRDAGIIFVVANNGNDYQPELVIGRDFIGWI